MTEVSEVEVRPGVVLRTLPHGTVIVWDPALKRSYPYYKAGPNESFGQLEDVVFKTDETDTVVLTVARSEPPTKRLPYRAEVRATDQPEHRAV